MSFDTAFMQDSLILWPFVSGVGRKKVIPREYVYFCYFISSIFSHIFWVSLNVASHPWDWFIFDSFKLFFYAFVFFTPALLYFGHSFATNYFSGLVRVEYPGCVNNPLQSTLSDFAHFLEHYHVRRCHSTPCHWTSSQDAPMLTSSCWLWTIWQPRTPWWRDYIA